MVYIVMFLPQDIHCLKPGERLWLLYYKVSGAYCVVCRTGSVYAPGYIPVFLSNPYKPSYRHTYIYLCVCHSPVIPSHCRRHTATRFFPV